MAQRLQIFFFVVWFAIFPAPKQNSDPLVSESAQSRVVIFATVAQLVIVSACPFGEADRLVGEFMECLLDELWACQSMMDPERFAAAFRHWSDSGMRLHLDGGFPSGAIRTKGSGQTRGADLAGAREAVEQIVIGMLSEGFRDLPIELLNGADQQSQRIRGSNGVRQILEARPQRPRLGCWTKPLVR